MSKPATAAEMLQYVSGLISSLGLPLAEVEADLLTMARWLDDHPGVDAEIHRAVTNAADDAAGILDG